MEIKDVYDYIGTKKNRVIENCFFKINNDESENKQITKTNSNFSQNDNNSLKKEDDQKIKKLKVFSQQTRLIYCL